MNKSNDTTRRRAGAHMGTLGRSAARLAVCQALYELDMSDSDRTDDEVITSFVTGAIGGFAIVEDPVTESEQEEVLAQLDQKTFVSLIRGTREHQADLDNMIGSNLTGDWSLARMEPVLRNILRPGVYEMVYMPNVPKKVVINEYVEVAHAFYAGPEPKLVNAVLDKIAKVART
jgi:N utilization substance protein B